MNPEQFKTALAQQGLELSDKQLQQFADYYRILTAANKEVNLTRITAQADVYLKHFYDSLTPLLTFKELFEGKKTLCDVGSGAGFPGIVLKIACPQLEVTIVDSLNKRLKFLASLCEQLGIAGVHLVHGRAEDAGHEADLREQFDIVTARAVANMATLSEYCLPFVKLHGTFLAMKGPAAQAELKKAHSALSKLGGVCTDVQELTLPDSDEDRTLILIKKNQKTPRKYARKAGTPSRKPL